jgi:hypothetical protein
MCKFGLRNRDLIQSLSSSPFLKRMSAIGTTRPPIITTTSITITTTPLGEVEIGLIWASLPYLEESQIRDIELYPLPLVHPEPAFIVWAQAMMGNG